MPGMGSGQGLFGSGPMGGAPWVSPGGVSGAGPSWAAHGWGGPPSLTPGGVPGYDPTLAWGGRPPPAGLPAGLPQWVNGQQMPAEIRQWLGSQYQAGVNPFRAPGQAGPTL